MLDKFFCNINKSKILKYLIDALISNYVDKFIN